MLAQDPHQFYFVVNLADGRPARRRVSGTYSMVSVNDRDYFSVRNEWWRDERRSALATCSNDLLTVRPKIGYFHAYDARAFALGRRGYIRQADIGLNPRLANSVYCTRPDGEGADASAWRAGYA